MKIRLANVWKNAAIGAMCFFIGSVKLSDMFILAPGIMATMFGVTGKIMWPTVCTIFGIMTRLYIYDDALDIIDYNISQEISLEDTAIKYVLILSVMSIGFVALKHKKVIQNGIVHYRKDISPVLGIVMVSSILTANVIYGSGNIGIKVVKSGAEGLIALLCVVLFSPGIDIILGKTDSEALKGNKTLSTKNICLVSLMLLWSVVLWGMPGAGELGSYLAFSFGLACVLTAFYYINLAVGIYSAVALGTIMVLKYGDFRWATDVLVTVTSMTVGMVAFGRRKWIVALALIVGICFLYILNGGNVEPYFLCFAFPVFLLLLLPSGEFRQILVEENQMASQVAVTGFGNLAEDKVDNMVQALKRLEFTFSGHDLPGISPMQMGQLLSEFKNSLLLAGKVEWVGDRTLTDRLLELGILAPSVYICKNAENRNVYYITGRTGKNRVVTGAQMSKILEKYFHRSMRLTDNSPTLFTWEGQTLVYEESAAYRGEYFVRRLKKCGSPISGDNFSVREYDNGRLALMLSDGMGSGSLASCESCMVLDIMEELLDIGFSPEYCIEFANESMSQKNQGRIFSTFDMCVIDLYKGTISSYKQGAATTYLISRGQDKNKIIAIESTTLPVGVLDKSEFDFREESLEEVNAVVMVSDGLDDMDRDERLMDVLEYVEIGSAKNLVNDILEGISVERNTVIRDDVTVMATVILKMK
jgi:stage II sporulation protein E